MTANDEFIADISAFESLQNQAHESMGMSHMSVFNSISELRKSRTELQDAMRESHKAVSVGGKTLRDAGVRETAARRTFNQTAAKERDALVKKIQALQSQVRQFNEVAGGVGEIKSIQRSEFALQ